MVANSGFDIFARYRPAEDMDYTQPDIPGRSLSLDSQEYRCMDSSSEFSLAIERVQTVLTKSTDIKRGVPHHSIHSAHICHRYPRYSSGRMGSNVVEGGESAFRFYLPDNRPQYRLLFILHSILGFQLSRLLEQVSIHTLRRRVSELSRIYAILGVLLLCDYDMAYTV